MSVQECGKIKFYIIVPVYKTEMYVRKCIESALHQTYRNFELILVDDGSPDNAGIICDQYKARDNRVHVIHKENEGQISARQTGIDFAKKNFLEENSFFIFLDSDDTLEADALAIISNVIIQNECDVVVYEMQRVYEGKILSRPRARSFTEVITDKRQLYKKVFGDAAYNPLCRKAIKCELMPHTDYSKFHHIRLGEDLLHSIPVYKECYKAVFIPDILYNYTVNLQSVTQSISYENYSVDSTVRVEVWRFLQKEGCFTALDNKKYLKYCCKLLKSKIYQICAFQTEKENMFGLFETIRNDSYYSMLLNTKHKGPLLTCLKNEDYRKIFKYAKVRRILGKIHKNLQKCNLRT